MEGAVKFAVVTRPEFLGLRLSFCSNQIDDLFDDFFVTDINHHPLITIENQIDITAQHMPQLVIDFDNIGKDWFAFEHVNKTRVDDRRGGKPKN